MIGKRESIVETVKNIDALTLENIRRVSNELFTNHKNSFILVVFGDENVDYVSSL